jgi:hypothetical protein
MLSILLCVDAGYGPWNCAHGASVMTVYRCLSQDEQFSRSQDHEAALIAMDLRRGMQRLISITNEGRGRDATIPVLPDLYLVKTALKMVIERVEAREMSEVA